MARRAIQDFDPGSLPGRFVNLSAACVLGDLIGFERPYRQRPAGLRHRFDGIATAIPHETGSC